MKEVLIRVSGNAQFRKESDRDIFVRGSFRQGNGPLDVEGRVGYAQGRDAHGRPDKPMGIEGKKPLAHIHHLHEKRVGSNVKIPSGYLPGRAGSGSLWTGF